MCYFYTGQLGDDGDVGSRQSECKDENGQCRHVRSKPHFCVPPAQSVMCKKTMAPVGRLEQLDSENRCDAESAKVKMVELDMKPEGGDGAVCGGGSGRKVGSYVPIPLASVFYTIA